MRGPWSQSRPPPTNWRRCCRTVWSWPLRNSPLSAVLAVAIPDLAALTRALDALSLPWQRLPVDFAFHSRQMQQAATALAAELTDMLAAAPGCRSTPQPSGAACNWMRSARPIGRRMCAARSALPMR